MKKTGKLKKLIAGVIMFAMTISIFSSDSFGSIDVYAEDAKIEDIYKLSYFNGNAYTVMEDVHLPWSEAKIFCENLGGHLVTITSREEQDLIDSLIVSGKQYSYWIGLYDDKKWVTGETFAFTNWRPGEPNSSSENRVHIWRESASLGKWNDTVDALNSTSIYSYNYCGIICEWEDMEPPVIPSDKTPPEILSISPKSGSKIPEEQSISISSRDDEMLAGLVMERNDGGSWTEVYNGSLNKNALITGFTLDMSGLESGVYEFRAKAIDHAGNESEYYTVSYDFNKPTVSAPRLSAEGKGWSVVLNWTMTNTEGLQGYHIYKRTQNSQSYSRLASITGTVFTDNRVEAGTAYVYMVEAVDSYGNAVKSAEVSVVPTHEDTVSPIADAGANLSAVAGKAVSFDGSRSWDNRGISSYLWNFGDGTSSASSKPSHTYEQAGTYTASLTVTDSAGNTDTHSKTVTVHASDKSIIKVTSNVPFMRIFSEQAGIDEYADSAGNYELILESGSYEFYFYSNGYVPQMKTIDTDNAAVNIRLEQNEIFTGNMNVRQLELEEIIALGIDITDPANQYVFEYTYDIELDGKTNTVKVTTSLGGSTPGGGDIPGEFEQEISVGEETFIDETGNIVYSQSGVISNPWITNAVTNRPICHCMGEKACVAPCYPCPCGGGEYEYNGKTYTCACGPVITAPPVVIFNVKQHTSWLKDFYEVELIIANNAGEGITIEEALASINLPEGLSLADTARAESKTVDMGIINGGEIKSASWIIRGDKPGSYNITADFEGMLMPFGEKLTAKFKTSKPIVIEGGKAVRFEVIHDGFAEGKQTWDVDFKLTNISDKPLYNVQFDYTGELKGYNAAVHITDMVIHYPGATVVIPWNDGKMNEAEKKIYFNVLTYDAVDPELVLNPGESVTGKYTVWFDWIPGHNQE